jgi:DNA polymerase-1
MNLSDEYPLTYEDFAARDKLKETNSKYGAMLDKFRTAVKRVVFGILYGAGPQKIAETIGISLEQAQQLIHTLFALFPSIKTYMAQTKWELQQFNLVETFFGRRRRFSVSGAPKYQIGRAERQTVNFKIQSTSSDIVMGRLLAIEEPLKDLGGRLLLTVHDSLGFQIKKKYIRQLPDFIYTYLEKGAADAHPWLPVAFKWDYEVGSSYGELKSLESYLANTKIEEYSNDAYVAEAFTEEDARTSLSEP